MRSWLVVGVLLALALPAQAGEVARGDLAILGLALEVDRTPVTTAVDIPATVQTLFAGKTNDEAPPAPGLSVLGELTGPGIADPITLATRPGHRFQLPALHEKGEYTLQSIRLVGESGAFLQQAVPSFAVIQVADVLQTRVRVRQLTAAELRERGINVDLRNYEVYEYVFVFAVDQHTVEVPYSVLVDKRTRILQPIHADPYQLPPLTGTKPPRFTPPQTRVFDLGQAGPPSGGTTLLKSAPPPPSIPAALVVPNGFGVLHQFFAVILHVENTAPDGSEIALDSVTATIAAPLQMRVAKVMPAVAVGQPVPVVDEVTGATFLVAGAKGSAEWTLEALKTGTHTVNIEVNATYRKPGQESFPLRGRVSTSLVVSDPRFHINFSHPETVRKDDPYTAYAFVTNLSPQRQHVRLDTTEIPNCSTGASFQNVCRTSGTGIFELDLDPGQMTPVPYLLTSKITGSVFAAAGSANDEALGISFHLTMGVSASGVPLSPATLVMPYYTRFLPASFVDAQMRLLGLGYSVATAPLNKYTALLPRVIKTDVFTRAQQIARTGQRVFITNPAANPHAFPNLALDLLGNTERIDQLAVTPELEEWDELRRREEAGRVAAAATARELERGFASARAFVDNFAAATSHRAPFLLAYVHGPPVAGASRPFGLSVAGVTSGTVMDLSAETPSGWTRNLRYGEVTRFDVGGEAGELALVGRWNESMRVVVLPQATAFTIDLLYPGAVDGQVHRAEVAITGATIGTRVVIELARGAQTLTVQHATGIATITEVSPTPLAVSGAAQDLFLDNTGHVVTLLLNRPVTVPAGLVLRDHVALTTTVTKANYSVTRRNVAGAETQIPGAVIQPDGRIVALTFDKTLSRNAAYEIAIDSLNDLLGGAAFAQSGIVPRIDNDRPGGILTGRVLRADNTPVPGVLVQLLMKDLPIVNFDGSISHRDVLQHDVAGTDGRFLYEFVPRDVDSNIYGLYDLETESPEGLRASLSGAVRLPGEVHTANLVFLGRGRAQGQVRYDDGTPIPNVVVSVGSTLYPGLLRDVTDADGRYDIDGLPVAPLTFSVVDPDGLTTFASNHLGSPGEVLTQDLVILRKVSPGLGVVRVTVKRSDTNAVVAGATVGVSSQGYPLQETFTDVNGYAEFRDVPAGLVTILASAWSISRHAAAFEVDLRPDQTIDRALVIQIADASTKYGTLEGTIRRDDPASPGDASKDTVVPGAIVTVGNRPAVVAAADGSYAVLDLPLPPAGVPQGRVWVSVFDPATGRKGWFVLPTLVEGSNHFSMKLTSSQPDGVATMRVRLYGARGEAVSGYRVINPGYPPTRFSETATGTYELADVSVPRETTVFAVPVNVNGAYGEQVASGRVRVDFHGQIGVTDVRLPGSGTIVVRLEVDGGCPTCPPTQALGPVAVTYRIWDEATQGLIAKTIEVQPDPVSGLVTLSKIPAQQPVTVQTVRHPAGFASAGVSLLYDGDARNVTLRMKSIGDITGRVLSHDGVTPVSGGTVRLIAGAITYAPALTQPDGSFAFAAIPANTPFELIAELNQDGLYRIGHVSGRTPTGGGPVSNLLITMREQSTVEGTVVDTNDAVVPLARYWLRELEWPFRSIGTARDPLFADINGRFVVGNVFTGAFRITAVHPGNQEVRGDYQGSLPREGDASQRDVRVRIGGTGVGAISVTVLDPLNGFAPVENAEVTLLRNEARFDFTSSNDAGVAFFDQVPASGTYRAVAYSKAVGRAGAGTGFTVANGLTTSTSVHLEFRGIVTGTMTDPESEPPNLPVKGMPVTLTGSVTTRDSTDENGAFTFEGIPEGNIALTGFQSTSNRFAFGPAGLFISKLVPERHDVRLELERTGTLTVKVYLPNDAGGPGELAPLAEVTACQCREAQNEYSYLRSAQGNPLVFPKMLRRLGYQLTVVELGGEARTIKTGGTFGASEYAKEQIVVLPASGSVEVLVVDAAGLPVADAQVRINGRTLYTPASGSVALTGLPFGWVTAQASKGNVAASAGGDLRSRSQPLRFTLNLGSSVSASGLVEAEAGGGAPSVKTRVVLTVTSSLLPGPARLETLTATDGSYTFTGIPVGGTTLSFLFYGPDDTTIGASRVVSVPNGATGTLTIPPVRLDATPPRVVAIDPPANSTNVSPGSQVVVTFSEPIAASYLNTQWFKLVSTDNNATVAVAFEASIRPDGSYVVKLTPPPPPAGQTFPLKSNMLYRFSIPQGIKDTTGNGMAAPVGSTFTTVNYTEPDIVRVDPAVEVPLFEGATFRVKFNKTIDPQSGFAVLERLASHRGVAVEEIPVTRYADPADGSTMVVAPIGVAIAESSFYRLRIAEVRDTQTPANVQREVRSYEYFSFDTKKPVVTIGSPADPLVSGVLYTITATVNDDGGGESADVAYVDWLNADGVALARKTVKPFSYSFVAPTVTVPTNLTLKASATDLSNNTSTNQATRTWEVIPNEAPRDVVVASTPRAVYPGGAVETKVRFADEGVTASVVLEVRGTKLDGTELRQVVGSQTATRASTSVDFAELTFRWNAPQGLKDGTASVIATITDSVNKSGTGAADLAILADTVAPVFVAILPAAESRYKFGVTNQYTIELKVRDDETAVERATFSVNGNTVLNATTGTYDAATRVTTFRTTVNVTPKNADTRIPIVITATDIRGNARTDTREVIYERVDDQTVPNAAWLTPLDGAALPSNLSGWQTTLRIRASDDQLVTSVRIESSAMAAPVTLTAPKSGTTDIFEAKTVLTMPADGSSFVIKAIVADGNPAHDVELAITVDPIMAAPVITTDVNISALTAAQYENKSVAIRGARVYMTVPLTLKDLMLIDGAILSVPEETKLDVVVTDRLFVDGDSRVDVSGKGWLGGLAKREDNSFTNSLRSGRTVGAAVGATNASASHAGIGGAYQGTTNAVYGSLTDPVDFGAGGAAALAGTATGGNGGGSVGLVGGTGLSRFVFAGPVLANGLAGAAAAGAGGSIDLRSRALITSPITVIAANGGDDDALANFDMGGGGGRVAIRTSERMDAQPAQFLARGGRNGTTAEGTQFVDGGAGTVYLVTPDGSKSLRVSSHDDRYPASTHRVMGTPLSAIAADSISIGPRALAVFDQASASVPIVDPTAQAVQPGDQPSITLLSTVPAANGSIAQNTTVVATYDAASLVGIREVRGVLSAQPADAVSYLQFAATVTGSTISASVPSTAPAGNATLKLLLRDRSGRIAETAAVPFTIVTNAAAVIDTFDVTPATESYAGRSLSVSAGASDDLAVQSLTLSASLGTVTSNAPATPTPSTMTRTFTVALPPTATPGSNVVLTLSALDDFPGRIATTATKSINIRHDTLPPSMTVSKPAANEQFNEGTGATFAVEVSASDAEVAVKNVTATFEGADTPLTFSNGLWRATLNVPNVDGTDPVAKSLVIKAFDYENNAATSNLTIYIKPLLDPNAPALSWVCASPGTMAPVGVATPFRILAVPSGGANGVQSVTFQFGANAPVNATSAGANQYDSSFTIPAGTADGTVFPVRVTARSVGGNESTLLGTLTAITGITINTASTIAAADLAFEDQSLIVVSGGTLTVIGPHRFKNVAILAGGTLIQKHVNPYSADALQVQRLSVACSAIVNVATLGLARNSGFPGAAAADYFSGGSHIGRGGNLWRNPAGAFGSVFEPKSPGAGAHSAALTLPAGAAGIGGGMFRTYASGAIVIDGTVTAIGQGAQSAGGGAGGSIWIETTDALYGAGLIEASGATATTGAGGGGAIALRAATISSTLRTVAKGGGSQQGRTGAAGTVARNDDVRIDNSGVTTVMSTELPAFGRALITSIAGNEVLLDRRFVSTSLIGHRLRSSGGGVYRLASITNDVLTLDGALTINTQDAVSYDGWLMYSQQGVGIDRRRLVAVRRSGSDWQYDTDSSFSTFIPAAGDVLFATFSKNAQRILSVQRLTCAGVCPTIDGLATAEMLAGDLTPNATMLSQNGPYTFLSVPDPSEILVRGDIDRGAFLLARGESVRIRLEPLAGTSAQPAPGETLRGVHQFNNLTLANAKVVTEDFVEITGALVKDASSTLSTGNLSVPVLDPSKMSIAAGLRGAVVVGTAGAVIDPDQPLEIVARNRDGSVPQPIVLEARNLIGPGTIGGLSVRHAFGSSAGEGASSIEAITSSGYLAFSASAATNVQVSLSPAHTTDAYAEPGHNSFRLKTNGTYEIWANAVNTGKTGTYDAATAFRIEKRPASLRWFVEDAEVHSVTTSVPASLILDLTFEQSATGEVTSIEYVTTGLPRNSFHARVAADGSFRVPVDGEPGDRIEVFARDRHSYSYASTPVSAGVLPSDIGVASLSIAPAEVLAGQSAAATITLLQPAGPAGAIVRVSSAHATVTVPELVTIPAGASTATFPVGTQAVAATVDVVINADYGPRSASAVLRVSIDTTPPAITINAPASGAVINEGPANKINLDVTASDAASGVKRVFATFEGQNYELVKGASIWTVQIPAPYVAGTSDVTKDIIVTAIDNTDNQVSSTRSIVIRPNTEATIPTIAWTCTSDGAMFPVNATIPMRLTVRAPNATNLIQKVEVVLTGASTTTFAATLVATDTYEAAVVIPDVADRTALTARAIATAISGTTAEVSIGIGAVKGATEIKASTTLGAGDLSQEGKSIVVFPGFTYTITGTHSFDRVVILGGGAIVPAMGVRLVLTTTSTYVACNGVLNASDRGYSGGTTYPGVAGVSGAVHLGTLPGGLGSPTYDSPYRPSEFGAGAVLQGGGAVRIDGSSVIVDGDIRAIGAQMGGSNPGSAGGSIWIRASKVSGAGVIDASGGAGGTPGGGGGVSIEHSDPAAALPRAQAAPGYPHGNGNSGSGIVYVFGPASTFGDAHLIDPYSQPWMPRGIVRLPALGNGLAIAGSSGNVLVTDRSADIPTYFEGHWVRIFDANRVVKGTWRIASVSGKTVTLGGSGVSVNSGDLWQGLYRFDTLRLRQMTLGSEEPVEYTTLDKDAGSTFDVNHDAPLVSPGAISMRSTINAIEVIGGPGAMADSNLPITAVVTNTRTGQVFSAVVQADGSFVVHANGSAGDSFTIVARDTHTYPRTSFRFAVPGVLEELNAIASFALSAPGASAGGTVLGTIRLAAPARSGGLTITLASSVPSVASVPASLVIPAGESTKQFLVSAVTSGASQLTATLGGDIETIGFTVRSATTGLTSLVVSPDAVEGGTSVNGTVTLGAPAPPAGAVITLTSSDSRVTLPATVEIPAGSSSASFTIGTSRVASSLVANLTASWDVTRTAAVTVTACASIGTVAGSASTPATIWFDDAAPTGATVTGPPSFDATQVASGSLALHFTSASGARQWAFTGATPLTVGPSDLLQIDVLVNPCNPPRQVLLTWSGAATVRASWGDDRMDSAGVDRIGALSLNGAWTRLAVRAADLGVLAPTSLTGLSIDVFDGEAWFDLGGSSSCVVSTASAPQMGPNDTLWFDDSLPAGAIEKPSSGEIGPFLFDGSQAATGTSAHHTTAATGTRSYGFTGATSRLTPGTGDVLFAWVLLDPCNPPEQVMLTWQAGADELHRAYWGENLILGVGTYGAANLRVGPLPEPGVWTRLEVPASTIAADGVTYDGMTFSVSGGHAWFDAVGKASRVNLALGKTARQSATLAGYPASAAVDGDLKTFSHTNLEDNSWWEVDLGAVVPIDSIEMRHRMDCCPERRRDFYLFVSEVPMTGVTVAQLIAQASRTYHYPGTAGASTEWKVRALGRYIRLRLAGFGGVNPLEVRVWGGAVAHATNVASGSTRSSQSSTLATTYQSRNAVNGDVTSVGNTEFSMSSTASEAGARWDIDLGRVEEISRVLLYNRLDNATSAQALGNLYVFVSDTPFTSTSTGATVTQPGVSPFLLGNWRWIHSVPMQRTGRYVRVQLVGTGVLAMSEVVVESKQNTLTPFARTVNPASNDGSDGEP